MSNGETMWGSFCATVKRRWLEWSAFLFFVTLVASALLAPLIISNYDADAHGPAFNVALSIGTSGIVAFVFYYVVNERLERRRAELVRRGALRAYRDAKRNIAIAVLHASQKGGRNDLSADTETIAATLQPSEFRRLFEKGREGHEGFYAFQNQMSERTPEFDEIIFNFRSIGRAFDRLVDTGGIHDEATYDQFVRLNALVRRIEHNGAGYDESKRLCSFVWEIFAGWSSGNGYLNHDPVERAIERS